MCCSAAGGNHGRGGSDNGDRTSSGTGGRSGGAYIGGMTVGRGGGQSGHWGIPDNYREDECLPLGGGSYNNSRGSGGSGGRSGGRTVGRGGGRSGGRAIPEDYREIEGAPSGGGSLHGFSENESEDDVGTSSGRASTGGSETGRGNSVAGSSEPAKAPGRRGYSQGEYGRIPAKPMLARISDRAIEKGRPKRTMLSIMRRAWKVGCYTITELLEKEPAWIQKVIAEFYHYYNPKPPVSIEEGRKHLEWHIRNNARKVMHDELVRTRNAIKKYGGDFLSNRPTYFAEDVWKSIVEHWHSEDFLGKSKQGSENIEKQTVPHSSGAMTFKRRQRKLEKAKGRPITQLELFVDTHTRRKKDKGKIISKAAKKIMDRYKKILRENQVDLDGDWYSEFPIEWWVQSVGGAKKNRVTGMAGRLDAYEILGKERQPRGRKKGDASSKLRDDLFMRVVQRALSAARADPDAYKLTPDLVNLLAKGVMEGNDELADNQELRVETEHALVHLIVAVLKSVYSTDDSPPAKKRKTMHQGDGEASTSSAQGNSGGSTSSEYGNLEGGNPLLDHVDEDSSRQPPDKSGSAGGNA